MCSTAGQYLNSHVCWLLEFTGLHASPGAASMLLRSTAHIVHSKATILCYKVGQGEHNTD